jgi:hypothetical protein
MGWLEAIADLIPTLPQSQLADWQQQRMPSIEPGKAYLIERTGARKDRDLLVHPGSDPSWTIKANIATDHKGANRHDPLNALLPDGKVVSLDARAIARLQSVPDWYELPDPIGVAVTLIGNGVPCLLAQRLMEALKPCLEPIQNRSTERGSAELTVEASRRSPQSEIPNQSIWLALDEIRRDGGTQPRAKIDLLHIKRLEEQIEEGQQLEPVVVFHDGENYWLADGFHRWHAHKNQEQPTIAALVHQGSRREAVLYSVGANADHKPALPRSRQDKHRAVMTLLNDEDWSQWSDREIARRCKVNNATVSRIRASLLQCNSDKQERTYKTKHG